MTVIGSSAPWSGGDITPHATCVLAPNPGPMTLDGTNTWLLHANGSAYVVDPGPDDPRHLAAIRDAADQRSVAVQGILLTHGHADHAEGAMRLAGQLGVGVRALDPAHRLGDQGLVGGDRVDVGGLAVSVIHTPGHTADSLCLWIEDDGSLLTGDTVLGRGTSLIVWPDGHLGDYLLSLGRLQDLATAEAVRMLLPGHGPTLDRSLEILSAYVDHRHERLAQVRAALAAGARTADDVVDAVYADVPEGVRRAALVSVQAQLAYLAGE